MRSERLLAKYRAHAPALAPGLVVVALMLLWAVHNGGYDTDTWYWGALLLLAVLACIVWVRRGSLALSRTTQVALGALAAYVAWSYLSITWAESKGDALQGSNLALMYFVIFALLVIVPWTTRTALFALTAFALGVGAIAVLMLVRLAFSDRVGALVIGGRLSAPTGYFNSTAALFTIGALLGIVLASRRELPAEIRGALIATACAGLQLAVIVQSRGWLFTLPLVAVAVIALVPNRLRVTAAAVLPLAVALVPIRRLLNVFKASTPHALSHAASKAGTSSLILCAAAFVGATLIAAGDARLNGPGLSAARRRWLGTGIAIAVLAACGIGGTAATHGHPFRFIERQWHGFSHVETTFSTQSHFSDVGSGRYDFWRVALDAFVANPIGGLGQDNFADYYLIHRRTSQEPAWPHSIELRLLASTGIVGFALFAVWLLASLRMAFRARRADGLVAAVAAVALLPLTVWLIHGSIDWFWEMPALSGPSIGFLAVAAAIGERQRNVLFRRAPAASRVPGWAKAAVAASLFAASVAVLAFPYLSVREVSVATNVAATNPSAALHDLSIAADLNPLSPDPGRLAGTIALRRHLFAVAEQRFSQSLEYQPDSWYSWLGAGLAASALGQRTAAHRDFVRAARINPRQPAVVAALRRVYSQHPLTPTQAFSMLVYEE